MGGERRSSSTTSRLSPLAPPFTINRSSRPSNSLTAYANVGLPSDHPSDHHLHSSPIFKANPTHFDYLSTCSIVVSPDGTSPSFHTACNSNHNTANVAASSPNNTLLKQGLPTAEGSQACLVTSAGWCGKCTGVLGKESQFGSSDTEQIDTDRLSFPVKNPNATTSKTLTSSVICCTAIPQESPELQLLYAVPAVNALCHDNTKTASNERCFSQISSYTAHPTGFHSSENNSFPAQAFGSSGGSTAVLVPRPVLSENYNSSGNLAVNNNENYSRHTSSSLMGLQVPQNAKGKEAFKDESILSKCKETKDNKFVESSLTNRGEFSNENPVSDVTLDPLLLEKSELRVSHPNLLDDSTYKSHFDERGVSVDNSSEMFDKYESYDTEVDSPCWKGTLVRCSLVEVSGTVNSQLLKNGLEECKKLNPLAPQFFPGSAEGNFDFRGNECCGGDLLAFQESVSSGVRSSYNENRLREAVEAGSCPSKVSNGLGAQQFDDIHDPTKECATVTSEINYSPMVIPSVMEYNFCSNEEFVTGANVSCSGKGIGDAVQNGSFCVPLLAREHVSDVPSSGGNSPSEIRETLSSACNSLSIPPTIDVQIVVKALHNLSELLVQNCSSDSNSLKEHDQDILQHVINNLYLCIRRGGQMTPVSRTHHPVTSYCPWKLTDFHEGTGMGFQATRTKAVGLQHNQDNHSEPEKQNKFSTVHSQRTCRVVDSFPSSSNADIAKGDDTGQVVEKVVRGYHQIEEDTHPQVLLYKNLWLDAEAALSSMKYKDRVDHMKNQDG